MKELNLGRNTAVTVINKIAGIILGIFTVRFLVLGLSSNDYGFYVFIWKISSTIFLADFGLGLAAQKKATQYLSTKDEIALNKDLSSIMYFYIVIFILFTLINYFFISPSLGSFFKIENKIKPITYYQNIFFIATTIIAFNFSISFFKEILAGLHKLYISEFLFLVNKFLVFFGILIFYWTNSSLEFICFIVPLIQTFTLLLMAKFCFGSVKDLKLKPSLVSISNLIETFKYSLHFYFQSLMVIVNNNIAHIVIGSTIGSVTIGMYQIAMKAQEIILNLNEFYQKNILPTLATFTSKNEQKNSARSFSAQISSFFLQQQLAFLLFTYYVNRLYIWLELITQQFSYCQNAYI